MKTIREYRTEIKWAMIFSGMTLAWMGLERLAGLHDRYIAYHPALTNLVAIPAITMYVLALRDKKKRDYHGQMNYLQGLISGLIITALVTVISPLTQVIIAHIISPHFFTNIIRYTTAHQLMPEQAARSYFSLNNYIRQALIGTPFIGFITSAIVALFIRSKS